MFSLGRATIKSWTRRSGGSGLTYLRRNSSSSAGTIGGRKITCGSCGLSINSNLFKSVLRQRQPLRKQVSQCKQLKGGASEETNYKPNETVCKVIELIAKYGPLRLHKSSDTRVNIDKAQVFLEALKGIPRSGIDLTGDHGTRVIPFIQEMVKAGKLEEPAGLIDVGGLNPDAVNLFDPDQKKQHTIVDINLLTPLANEEQKNVKYEVTDAEDFAEQSAKAELERIRNKTGKPVCIVLNNFLNAVEPKKGLSIIEKLYAAMQKGDQLIMSGLPAARLAKNPLLVRGKSEGGLVQFQRKSSGTFHRTAIDAKTFVQTLQKKLEGATLKRGEEFQFLEGAQHKGVRFVFIKGGTISTPI